ncbi:hypothetical protein [Paenibacillus tarimensis]|uniref:hypothetical protein n=1 Tax=Paenibacillus tarimensis TaxID=416012 RepID=UPI001F30C197|nr:hypothetical protein [Paenibacillus tarimensis]MCF2945406.1 hypothetical protein [Paenibacillus tarimensis]
MKIHTDEYTIAPLNGHEQAVDLIQQAEDAIAELTGQRVTLIAYERNEDAEANKQG